MLTTSQAAEILGVSRPRVITLIHLGTLRAEKPGRDWQIDPASVEAYKKSPRKPGRKVKPNGAASVAKPEASNEIPQRRAADLYNEE